jgi:DNA-binding CsgD family transcriptional regulator
MKKNVSYEVLAPIELERLRQSFSLSKVAPDSIKPFEIFKPTLQYFEHFAVGPYFWFILDLITWRHVMGGGAIAQMTPLESADFLDGNHQKLYDITHPDDLPHVMAFSEFWVKFEKALSPPEKQHMKMTMYFRLQNREGNYYWIMVQYADAIRDDHDHLQYGLVLVTDISHIKKEGSPFMSILNTSEGNCQHFVCMEQMELGRKEIQPQLTRREIQLLRLLTNGLSSKQMAAQLNLSVKTVDNHRQNMLHKTNTKSSAELTNYCIRMGYL